MLGRLLLAAPHRGVEPATCKQLFVPAAFIGVGGWVVARGGGRSPRRAFLWSLGFVAAGALVAALKVALSGH